MSGNISEGWNSLFNGLGDEYCQKRSEGANKVRINMRQNARLGLTRSSSYFCKEHIYPRLKIIVLLLAVRSSQ